jgi:hypothetical protein
MTTEQWQEYLQYCSAEMLKDSTTREFLPESVFASGWMGYEPASEEEIKATEDRLGIWRFPSTMRNFYQVTNGWRHVSYFIHEILPIERVGWLKDVIPDLWTPPEHAEEAFEKETDLAGRFNLYTQYVRVNRSIVVAEEGDSAHLLMDPYVQFSYDDKHDEWAGGTWASWNPAMDWTSRSFEELFKEEFESYVRLRDTPPKDAE